MTVAGPLKLGAAMPIEALPRFRDWLLSEQRDLELQDPTELEALDGDWAPRLRQARAALTGFRGRLGIHGPFEGLPILTREPRIRAVVIERLQQALAFGAELGATHMVVHSPLRFMGGAWLPHSPAYGRAAQFELIHACLDPVVEYAESVGCTLVLECIDDKNPEPLVALIRSFGSERVRLSVDVGHAYIAHTLGGAPPDAWVRAGGELLAHVHLQDTDAQIDRHWPPGHGPINWHALFSALRDAPAEPRLLLEVKSEADIASGAAYLSAAGLAY